MMSTNMDLIRNERKEHLQKLRNKHSELASTMRIYDGMPGFQKLVVADFSKPHTITAENTTYDLGDDESIRTYCDLRMTSLSTLLKEISALNDGLCLDGLPACALADLSVKAAGVKIREFLCAVTAQGKQMPLINATPETETIDAVPLKQSKLKYLEREFCLSQPQLARESPNNKHVIGMYFINPDGEKSSEDLESFVSKIGASGWSAAITKPSIKAVKTGRCCFTKLVGVLIRSCSLEVLKKIVTERTVVEALVHMPAVDGINCTNRDQACWQSATKDLTYGSDSPDRFAMRLVQLLGCLILEPALHVEDIVKPVRRLSYNDHFLVIRQATSSLGNYRKFTSVRERLSTLFVQIGRALTLTNRMPVRGTLVIIFKLFLIDIAHEKIPWGVESYRRLKEVFDTQVGPDPFRFFNANAHRHVEALTEAEGKDLARHRLLKKTMPTLSMSFDLSDVSLLAASASVSSLGASSGSGAGTDAVKPRKAPAGDAPPMLRKLQRGSGAIKRPWFRTYLKTVVKKGAPPGFKPGCSCGKCWSCYVINVIADYNATAYLANGLPNSRMVTYSPKNKISSCSGGLVLKTPIALQPVCRGRW